MNDYKKENVSKTYEGVFKFILNFKPDAFL